jgi:hypothetical protein
VSIQERVTVLEGRTVGEIERLNFYFHQSAAMFEHDGAAVQDLSARLFRALARIDDLEAAVMARPREDRYSAGLGASSDTVAYAERSKNFATAAEDLVMARLGRSRTWRCRPSRQGERCCVMCRLMLKAEVQR